MIGRLKRTAQKAEAHVGCCHGTHLGDGSLLPKMAVLLLGHPVEINLSGAPSFLSLVLLSAPASSIYMLERRNTEKHKLSSSASSALSCWVQAGSVYLLNIKWLLHRFIYKPKMWANRETRTWCECYKGGKIAGQRKKRVVWQVKKAKRWDEEMENGLWMKSRDRLRDLGFAMWHRKEVSHCVDRLMDLQFIRHEWKGKGLREKHKQGHYWWREVKALNAKASTLHKSNVCIAGWDC